MGVKISESLTIGLDIGIASVGWAVLAPNRIVALGVRCFDPGEDSDGKPHNQKRRGARVARNRLHMRRWRLRQLLRLFFDVGIIPSPDPQLLMTPPRAKGEPEMGPWQLRAKGLKNPLEPIEWARVLYHLVKHRGFEFFRKSELSELTDNEINMPTEEKTDKTEKATEEKTVAKEKQQLNKALESTRQLLDKYRKRLKKPNLTVGALAIWLTKDSYAPDESHPDEDDRKLFVESFRNKGKSYRHAFFRAALRHELQTLFDAQIEYKNQYTTLTLPTDGEYIRQMLATYGESGIPIGGESRAAGKTFKEAVFDLFDLQHPPLYAEQIKEMVGECELIASQPRASKNSFSAERATWLEKLNGLYIRRDGPKELSPRERACLINLPYEHSKITLKLVRETLMEKTGFPASWQEASFNVASYRAKPTNDGAWILIAPHNSEPISLIKWADNKARKKKLKETKKMLTGGIITYKQLREKLGLTDSDRFIWRLKETNIIPRDEETKERIPFATQDDGILLSGHSFRYAPVDGKPKAFPRVAWKFAADLRSHSTATLADWRTTLTQLKDFPGNWQFEHSILHEEAIEPKDEESTKVPLQFEDAQAIEGDFKFIELKGWHALRKALAERFSNRWAQLQLAYREHAGDKGKLAAQAIDDIATVLAECQTDLEIQKRLTTLGYASDEIEILQTISFRKFRNLSFEALRKILPHLEAGHVYSEACKLANLSHSEKNKTRTKLLPPLETYVYQRYRHGKRTGHIENRYKELRNPVVARSFNQARLVFNALVIKHGSPTYVHVETARDLARSKRLRMEIQREQETSRKRAEELRDDLKSRFGYEPTPPQLLKMRLYGEQGGKCLYTGKSLEPYIDAMLSGDESVVEIDHIWPRSQTFDNSLDNRVLVLTGSNQNKGQRIPFQFIDGTNGKLNWSTFEKFVLSCKGMSAEKQRRLLSKNLEDADEFLARNLVDTRYVTRMLASMLRERVEFSNSPSPEELQAVSPDDDGKTRWNRHQRARVRTPQGRLVDFLRGKWGLAHAKNREKSDLHHAVDACIIAVCTPSLIQRVNNYFAQEENSPHVHKFKRNSDGTYMHRGTGEIISEAEARKRGLYLPAPWDDLDKGKFRRDLLSALNKVFVSRRPKRKSAGELHDAQAKGIRYLPVPLVDLTKDMLADAFLRGVTGYRRENYETLRAALETTNGDAQATFVNGYEIQDKLIHSIALPVWSLPDNYLKQRKRNLAKANKENGGTIIENMASVRKTVPLTDLTLKMLTEKGLGSAFYQRNKELIEALRAQLEKEEFDGKAEKAFAEPFRPPIGKSGKERPLIRSIRLPDTHGSGMLVRGGITGLGDSISTEVWWTSKNYFFRPRYQADEKTMFGLEEPPTGAVHLFNLRIDEPIQVELIDGTIIPSNNFPGYFVVYEGDGRMQIREHDRPGKTRRKIKKSTDGDNEEQSAETEKDTSLVRFSVGGIKKLRKFKADALGNYKELHTHLQHGLA